MTKPLTDADMARMRVDAGEIIDCYTAFQPKGIDPEVLVARDVFALLAEVERLRAEPLDHPIMTDIFAWIFRADPYRHWVKCRIDGKVAFTDPGDGKEYEIVVRPRTSP